MSKPALALVRYRIGVPSGGESRRIAVAQPATKGIAPAADGIASAAYSKASAANGIAPADDNTAPATAASFAADVDNCAARERYSPLAKSRLIGALEELTESGYIGAEMGKTWERITPIGPVRVRYSDILALEYFQRALLKPGDVIRRIARKRAAR